MDTTMYHVMNNDGRLVLCLNLISAVAKDARNLAGNINSVEEANEIVEELADMLEVYLANAADAEKHDKNR